jgi:hypothetical protein
MDETSIVERRITIRLLAYWEKLRGLRPMPTEEDIDPDYLNDLWDYCFLVHVKDLDKPDYNYTYLGSALQAAYQGELTGDKLPDIATINASKLTGNFAKVIEKAAPWQGEGQFINLHNDVVKYRQCLLPLGENGVVDAVFGGMRFKVYNGK